MRSIRVLCLLALVCLMGMFIATSKSSDAQSMARMHQPDTDPPICPKANCPQ